MSSKIKALPADSGIDVEWLMPKTAIIVVGKEKYEIEELVSSQYKKLISTISKIFLTIYSLKEDTTMLNNESMYITKMIEIVAEDIVPIIGVITGVPEEEIDANITATQIAYAAKCVWDINARNLLKQISELKSVIDQNLIEFGFANADGIDDTYGTPLESANV
jgi:hypothetical protein